MLKFGTFVFPAKKTAEFVFTETLHDENGSKFRCYFIVARIAIS